MFKNQFLKSLYLYAYKVYFNKHMATKTDGKTKAIRETQKWKCHVFAKSQKAGNKCKNITE